MNNISAVPDSPFRIVDSPASAPDLYLIFGSDSSDSDLVPESPKTRLGTGNPRPISFVRRSLPEALFGLSPSQFACGFTSLASGVPCALRLCMVHQHHVARARADGDPSEQVVQCSRPGCGFVAPCFRHFVSAAFPVRRSRRARYSEYFFLIRRLMLSGRLFVPPPMPALPFGTQRCPPSCFRH